MNPTWTTGTLLGLAAGAGLLLIWARLPARNRPTLDDRLAPYVGAPTDHRLERLLADQVVTPFPTLERIVRPYLTKGAASLERVLGGGASISRRLEQAGRDQTLHQFRIEQLIWGAVAGTGAVAMSLVMLLRGYSGSPVLLVIFCAAVAVGGIVACDHRLSAAVRERERRMMAEFPTIADLLALSVAAGEGAVGALERVARSSRGELARELYRALADARTGAGLVEALDRIADRTSLTPLARFVDGVAVAVERGTPLADVLRAQAADVRELRKRSLMEIGSRKELAMLVPVVFLVLPVTIIFALYPGFIAISTVVP
ncbi:type II secretion system F family protein [Phytoactinopolyspora mesophila]|uniref:Pilus assembly protein TadB n=1 Tax=Phytoactinopolyspora mesophila TaxID=2650750 RepID=A0A7K3M5K9_9ACTN|nr:type II secretion system F family protein [Phytoactinopolyspora mesophila]NDL58609.1 pilus assembly protein TadB [Phytoactinopolyspora mesophila]